MTEVICLQHNTAFLNGANMFWFFGVTMPPFCEAAGSRFWTSVDSTHGFKAKMYVRSLSLYSRFCLVGPWSLGPEPRTSHMSYYPFDYSGQLLILHRCTAQN